MYIWQQIFIISGHFTPTRLENILKNQKMVHTGKKEEDWEFLCVTWGQFEIGTMTGIFSLCVIFFCCCSSIPPLLPSFNLNRCSLVYHFISLSFLYFLVIFLLVAQWIIINTLTFNNLVQTWTKYQQYPKNIVCCYVTPLLMPSFVQLLS